MASFDTGCIYKFHVFHELVLEGEEALPYDDHILSQKDSLKSLANAVVQCSIFELVTCYYVYLMLELVDSLLIVSIFRHRDRERGYAVMLSTESSNMLDKSYLNQAIKEYVSADLFVVYTSIIIGIFACKTVHKKHHFISCVSIALIRHWFSGV